MNETVSKNVHKVLGRENWLGEVLVGGILLVIPIVNLRALGQIVLLLRGTEEEDSRGFWLRGWFEGAGAAVLLAGYSLAGGMLVGLLALLLRYSRIFAALAPVVQVAGFLIFTAWALSAVAALAEGTPLVRAADPLFLWGRVRRAPGRHLAAALCPFVVGLLGFWILPFAVFLGLWVALELLCEPGRPADVGANPSTGG